MVGIACTGHWFLDKIKFIDHWPQKTEICNVEKEQTCSGGAPFN